MIGKKLTLSIAFLFSSSIFIVLTLFADYKSTGIQKIFSIIISTGFWLSIILGYVFLILAQKNTKSDKLHTKPGAVRFFTNKYARISDAVLFLSVVCIVALSIIKLNNRIAYIVLISIIFFTFNLHCILNGRIFNNFLSKKRGV